ncbi:MAG: acyl-CoA-binding protein [Polaribacter sp.]|jgi:acyl-CoA-binding protein|nr:acyl-CoA-binding protein [Polaribacter sp.]MDG1953598.1 acyl-CoA-binding protein [Polaribacter sp.]MDG2074813.1 acyl-CoA-binding protein [Polaribacter sp.]
MSKSIDIQFQDAYKIVSSLSQDEFAPDIMLKLYAYYKQATYGDNNPAFIETDELDLRNGFKLNAWIQLRGMSIENAKKEYVKIVKQL